MGKEKSEGDLRLAKNFFKHLNFPEKWNNIIF